MRFSWTTNQLKLLAAFCANAAILWFGASFIAPVIRWVSRSPRRAKQKFPLTHPAIARQVKGLAEIIT